jgi:hypothetical protein
MPQFCSVFVESTVDDEAIRWLTKIAESSPDRGEVRLNRSDVDTNVVNVGLKYGYGAANVSVGGTYCMYDENDLDDRHLFVVPGDAGILRGACPRPTWVDAEDPNVRDDTIVEQDNRIGGVVSVQLD